MTTYYIRVFTSQVVLLQEWNFEGRLLADSNGHGTHVAGTIAGSVYGKDYKKEPSYATGTCIRLTCNGPNSDSDMQ